MGYDDKTASELLDGFSEGFLCIILVLGSSRIVLNIKSVRDNKYDALRLVLEEVQTGTLRVHLMRGQSRTFVSILLGSSRKVTAAFD